jgi:hypothetical protein
MKEKIAADIAVIVPAVGITWFDMFDGGLKLAVGIVTLAAVIIRLRIVLAEWKSRQE